MKKKTKNKKIKVKKSLVIKFEVSETENGGVNGTIELVYTDYDTKKKEKRPKERIEDGS